METLRFSISDSHPALPGHFPGQPIVPGVVIIDQVISIARQHMPFEVCGVRKSKFTQILKAEEEVEITFKDPKQIDDELWRMRFRCTKTADNSLLAEGNLNLKQQHN